MTDPTKDAREKLIAEARTYAATENEIAIQSAAGENPSRALDNASLFHELADALLAAAGESGAADVPPWADATPDEAFELGEVAGYDKAMTELTQRLNPANEETITGYQFWAAVNPDHSGGVK